MLLLFKDAYITYKSLCHCTYPIEFALKWNLNIHSVEHIFGVVITTIQYWNLHTTFRVPSGPLVQMLERDFIVTATPEAGSI